MAKKEWELIIVADTNDGDYVTEITAVDTETLDKIKPLVKAIKNFKPYIGQYESYDGTMRGTTHDHNWPDGECLREDMGEKNIYEIYSDFDEDVIDTFRDLCPVDEYGIHTIESVKVCPYVKKEKWL